MPKPKNDKSAPARTKTVAAKRQSTGDKVIALLKREGGATIDEMVKATGWQKHSVRGFMAGALKKRYGLTALSEKSETGRVYRITAEAHP